MKRTRLARLLGGPLHGTTRLLPPGQDTICIGRGVPLFIYTFAGRDGTSDLFAIRSTARRERAYERWHIRQHGQDPRVAAITARPVPYRKGRGQ